ncbi:unnamed protein product [Candidula unifasciata]|uniref:WD repeat-containing protein 76 n=1 Tax=Candidula unifasciata TaxID=100452 RepID=A0A8S4A350_9EUPU|nr:unnamed protein product [Candidula unifasciata]
MRNRRAASTDKTSQCGNNSEIPLPVSDTVSSTKPRGRGKRDLASQALQTIESVGADDEPAVQSIKTRRSVSAVQTAVRFSNRTDKNKELRATLTTGERPNKRRKLVSNEQSPPTPKKEVGLQESERSFSESRAERENESKENILKLYSNSDVREEFDVKEEFLEKEELLNYQRIRELNVKANEDFFASLGLDEAKEALQLSVKKKIQPSQRGLKIHKEPETPLPRRCSLRIRHKDPIGKPVPEPESVFEEARESRLPPGPVAMKDCVYSKSDVGVTDDYVRVFSTLISQTKPEKMQAPVSRKVFQSALEKVAITERRIAKVVPGRVFSLTWHPSSHTLISVAGDKYGHIGFWDVTSSNIRDQDTVRVFKPHISPVSDLFIPPADPHKLYSCSYDATLRRCDFEREVFDEVFSVAAEKEDLFRNFSFIDATSTMLVSQFSGNVSLVDTRTPSTSAEQVYHVSAKSLRTVSVHPTYPHYFITAGVDAKILLWDLRSISSTSAKPVQKLEHHTKALSCAYFSPTGHKVLSSSSDDTILVYSVGTECKLELIKRMHHNNFTGRWLTKFQPTWHPTVEDVFVSGSMSRPRQIEVFSADGVLLKALKNEDLLGSVCSLNMFHPNRTCTLVGANSSGRLHVFM